MELFELMNKKLDEGWRMTDGSCQQCSSLVLFNPKDNTYNCIKCRAPVKLSSGADGADPDHQRKEKEYKQEIVRRQSQNKPASRSDEVSKLMSAKLLQGWAMLENACEDCNVPLMKNKQGDEICCACQRNYKKKNPPAENSSVTVKQPPKEAVIPPTANTAPAVEHKKPQRLQSKSKDRQIGSGDIGESVGRTLILAARFYQERMERAIQRNDEHEVSRILQALKELISIGQSQE